MSKSLRFTAAVFCFVAMLCITATFWTTGAHGEDATKQRAAKGSTLPPLTELLDRDDFKLGKEPKYAAVPRYALLVFGAKAQSHVWMVEDGKTLYVDKNANGDLTDDGPPLEQAKLEVFSNGKNRNWQCEYALAEIKPKDRPAHTTFALRRWNYGEPNDSYGLSINVDGQTPMYAGWFGTFWSASTAEVPLVHFGGALSPKLLRFKELVIGAADQRLSIAFINAGSGDGAAARLSIDALALETVPVVEITWPTAAGEQAIRTSHRLTERCCYWEFYNLQFKAPAGVVPGTAQATILLPPESFPLELATITLNFPVVAQASSKSAE